MKSAKGISIVFTIVLWLVSAVSAEHLDTDSKDELIAMLKRIATGYEENAQQVGPIRLEGRIFNVQKAREGAEIPANQQLPAKWVNFVYMEKQGERRYEQDRLVAGGKRFYVLDNNKRIFLYSTDTVVRIFPLTDEEQIWTQTADMKQNFVRLGGVAGEENVGTAMRSWMAQILDGTLEQRQVDLAVDVAEDDLIEVTLTGRGSVREYTIDPNKGFNMVKRTYEYVRSTGELLRDFDGAYEYTQLANGAWILSKSQHRYSANDTVGERRFEVEKITEDAKIPDDLFDAESLTIPENIYTVDYSFSPPLQTGKP